MITFECGHFTLEKKKEVEYELLLTVGRREKPLPILVGNSANVYWLSSP
jgi:hypothetical protein